MSGTTIFVRTPTLKLTVGQRNGLKSFMKKTKDKNSNDGNDRRNRGCRIYTKKATA